jgi:hypothetical protein
MTARHKRPLAARPDPRRLAAGLVLAGVAGLGAVTAPVAVADQHLAGRTTLSLSAPTSAIEDPDGVARGDAATRVSRDRARPTVVRAADDAAAAAVTGPHAVPSSTPGFAQEDTTIVGDPIAAATRLADLDRGAEIALTGRLDGGYAEIVRDGALAWVRSDDVAGTPPPKEVAPPRQDVPAPTAGAPSGVSDAPCPGGSRIESGLRPNTIKTYRAVCAAFPGLVYGGVRPGDPGEHGTGEALDIMVGTATGNQVAAYLQQNAARLGVDNVIWRQRIWFVGNPSTQWKSMEDRGSAVANHMDHVHVGTR